MPLQIRRGPTADRLATTPLVGEIVFDTELNSVYIGDGITPGGRPVSAFSEADAQRITVEMFLGITQTDNSFHSGITFQRFGNRIVATVSQDLTNYPGTITAEGFIGNIFASDSTQILDAETGTLTGRLVGDVLGSVFADDSTKLIDGTNGSVNLDGTVRGSIVPDQNERYDLGNYAYKFRDLYLSGSSIWLGDAKITSAGGVVDLPAGSTVGGFPPGLESGQTYDISILGNVISSNDSSVLVNTATNEFQGIFSGTFSGIADLTGSVFGDDSTTLVNGPDSSINLNETIKGNAVPFDSETHDLGSFTRKFRRLYLTEGANLYLGNAVISSSSTTIDLPAGSTVGGSPIGSGAGSGDVVGPASTTDSAIALFDTTTGKLLKSSSVTVSGFDITGNVTGTVTGSLIGNVSGNVFGDINGSVFSDDSTLIVDATESKLYGALFGPVNSDLPSVFRTDLSSQRIISLQQSHDDSVQSSLTMSRTRGTQASPTTLIAEDGICNIDFSGFNGTSTLVAARIKGLVEGTITGSAVPGRIEFITADSSGELRRRMYINSDGAIVAEAGHQQNLSNYAGGLAGTVLYQNYDDANIRNFIFAKSRGSFLSPTSVTTNDIIGQISFNGYESGAANYIQAAAIRVTAQSISAGVVTSSISFFTNDGSTISTRVSIGATGRLNALNSLAVSGVIRPFTTNGNLVLDAAAAGTGEVRTTSRLSVADRILIEDNKISTLSTNDDIELDPSGTGTVDFQITEQLTVGAAGAADALPATPSTYFKIKVNGIEYVVPAYAVS
jgi:uncharacterized protein YcfJ